MSTQIPPYEPPNGAKEDDVEQHDPATAHPGGEERFEDTGGTMQSFEIASAQVAQILKKV